MALTITWTPNADSYITTPLEIGGLHTDTYSLLRGQFGGFSGAGTEDYTTKAPFQDGRTFHAQTATERTITMTFRVNGTSFDDLNTKKRDIAGIFAPVNGQGTLDIEFPDGRAYRLDALPYGAPIFDDRAGGRPDHTVCTVMLIAYSPFWFDPVEQSVSLALYGDGFVVPFVFPVSIGMSGATNVCNEGHVSTPIHIEIPGAVTDPVIENVRTGEKISVVTPIAAGETLVIDTSFDAPVVQLIQTDGTVVSMFSAVSSDSEFFQLLPGDNEISIADTTSIGGDPFVFSWYNRYWGVL
jgi:Phage tail protein.